MTDEEKRLAIGEYCNQKKGCISGQKYPCPLYGLSDKQSCVPYDDPQELDRNFKLISAMPDYKGPKEEAIEPIEPEVDMVNEPPHYKTGIECIEELELVFGVEAVKHFCLCNVWKYRKRALIKNGQEDLDKADWYMAKYKELEEKDNEIHRKLP